MASQRAAKSRRGQQKSPSSPVPDQRAKSARLHAVYSALSAVHHVAAQARSAADLFDRACKALVRGDVYQTAWAGRFDEKKKVLVVTFAAGEIPEPTPTTVLVPSSTSAWLTAVLSQRAVAVHADDTQARCGDGSLCFGLAAALVVPVSLGSTELSSNKAVLCVGASDPTAFDDDEIALLVELGRSLTAHAERIAAERALLTQRELLRAVFDCASYGIYYATADGEILLCNDAFLRLTGTRREETVGRTYQDITAEDQRETERKIIDDVLETCLPSEYDKEFVRADGFQIPVRMSVAPVRDRSGKPVGTVTIVRDTVAEREAAAALRDSEERYRAAFRNNPDALFVINAQGIIVDANPSASLLTGLGRDRLLMHPLRGLCSADEQPEAAIEELVSAGALHRPRLRFCHLGDMLIETEVHGTALGHGLWQVLVRNIQDRVIAENNLIALKDRLEEKVAARTRQLEEANVALAMAGRLKDQFLANMSHELRTPLNSVLGFSDALLEGVFGDVDEQQRSILMTMRDSGHHLLELINDILDLSKIDAGRLELDLRSISVIEVCQTCLRMVRPAAVSKRIGTWMRTAQDFRVVVADERRLKQMIVNLVSNAVKFTPTGGQVGIEAWSHGDAVCFAVTDTGIGISPPDIRRIFEPFTQIDSSLARQQEGTGLGLALVKKLAELHGGRIDVESEPGSGSRFTIVLPRIPQPESDSINPAEGR